MEIIESKEDWEWHKRQLDANAKYDHAHRGQPTKFPCKVKSEFGDDPNGPYYYEHSFVYQKEMTCEHCGHKTIVWPE